MSPKTLVFLLTNVALTVIALPTKDSSSYCYSKDPKPYTLFGSMEAYEPKHGDLSKIQSPKGKQSYLNKTEKLLNYFI